MSSSLGNKKTYYRGCYVGDGKRQATNDIWHKPPSKYVLSRGSHTSHLQTGVGNVADKEKELKVTQKDPEGMKEEVALKSKALDDRDKERAAREKAYSDLEVSKRFC